MPGITHSLSIAKEALLTHQLAVQVASHNIANVDTPGYSRQTLEVGANGAVPTGVGNIGSGIKATSILRHYDQFMTQRIFNQSSLLGNLQAQKDAMRVVETVFNETMGTGLNNLMSMFWDSWQELSDNPDIQANRQSLVQVGQVVSSQLEYMNEELAKIKYDVALALDTALSDVNYLSAQVAELNIQILSSETGNNKANDLRDQRDEVVRELSELLDISYIESGDGAYTVMLPDGHPIVDKTEFWKLSWADNSLNWTSTNAKGITFTSTIGSGSEVGGKIGGWLEVRGELIENVPDNYLGRLDAFANALIREVNQQFSQGVGSVAFSSEILGKSVSSNTSVLTTTVDATTALQSIQADIFIINQREVGRIDGAAAVNGLAMGKTYNAVQAINDPVLGVTAKMTTLVAGSAITPLAASPANDGDVISFDINGVNISYTIDNDGVGTDDSDVLPATTLATNVVNAINAAITAYNASATNPTDVTISAAVGDGTNGGVLNSIVLRNTNAGDESNIIIANLASNPVTGIEANLGLTAGTYNADATHNTGQITLFSHDPYEVEAGIDDRFLDELGMGGGLHVNDPGGDGEFSWSFSEGGIINSLQGYKYADELQTDGKSIEIWLYNKNGTLALPQPVSISMDRAYTLQDVAESINVSITNASGGAAWLTASVYQNQLQLTPDADHDFAFGTDDSNILQVAEINTFFTGYSAGTLKVNTDVVDNLDLITAARVNQFGEIFMGDNSNSLEITNIQRAQDVDFTGGVTGNLDGFYNSLISAIGSKGRTVNTEYEFNEMVNNQLSAMRDNVSGVSLDEEMANLVKFQHAYTAAARLITISDEMLLTLINTVRR